MSKLKESQMQEWLTILSPIFEHIDSEDKVLATRSKKIKQEVESWLACDRAHSLYQEKGWVDKETI